MQNSCYDHAMANLQVRNMPDTLHNRLKQHARKRNCSMSAAVLDAIERELTRWEWRERLADRPKTDLGTDAADLLADMRRLRDTKLE